MTLLFVIQWTSLLREFLILLSSQFLSIPLQTQKGIPPFITKFITIPVLIRMAFPIIWELFHARMSLNLVLLLSVLNSVCWSKLQLIYIFFIINIRTRLIYHIVFSCLYCCQKNLLDLKWNLDRLVILVKELLRPPNLLMLLIEKRLSLTINFGLTTLANH